MEVYYHRANYTNPFNVVVFPKGASGTVVAIKPVHESGIYYLLFEDIERGDLTENKNVNFSCFNNDVHKAIQDSAAIL